MFEECGYEVYEGRETIYITKDINDEEGAPTQVRSQVKDPLFDLQQRYYELEDEVKDQEPEHNSLLMCLYHLQNHLQLRILLRQQH